MFKTMILGFLLIVTMDTIIQAPVRPPRPEPSYYTMRVRLTTYSPKEKRENNKTSTGKSAKNENGVATHKSFLPIGTKIILPNGETKTVDDRVPTRSARKFGYKVIDIRFYQSIKSKPKTKAVKRELRKLDKGYGEIKIFQ